MIDSNDFVDTFLKSTSEADLSKLCEKFDAVIPFVQKNKLFYTCVRSNDNIDVSGYKTIQIISLEEAAPICGVFA